MSSYVSSIIKILIKSSDKTSIIQKVTSIQSIIFGNFFINKNWKDLDIVLSHFHAYP